MVGCKMCRKHLRLKYFSRHAQNSTRYLQDMSDLEQHLVPWDGRFADGDRFLNIRAHERCDIVVLHHLDPKNLSATNSHPHHTGNQRERKYAHSQKQQEREQVDIQKRRGTIQASKKQGKTPSGPGRSLSFGDDDSDIRYLKKRIVIDSEDDKGLMTDDGQPSCCRSILKSTLTHGIAQYLLFVCFKLTDKHLGIKILFFGEFCRFSSRQAA